MSHVLSTQGIRIEQEPASFGARLLAFIIDFIIFLAFYYGIVWISANGLDQYINYTLLYFLNWFLPFLYPLVCETFFNGQTLGKYMLHIRVMALDGGGPKVTSLILRWLLLPIDLFGSFGIGILCIFFTRHQQRLGDLVAGTWVVRTHDFQQATFTTI